MGSLLEAKLAESFGNDCVMVLTCLHDYLSSWGGRITYSIFIQCNEFGVYLYYADCIQSSME